MLVKVTVFDPVLSRHVSIRIELSKFSLDRGVQKGASSSEASQRKSEDKGLFAANWRIPRDLVRGVNLPSRGRQNGAAYRDVIASSRTELDSY